VFCTILRRSAHKGANAFDVYDFRHFTGLSADLLNWATQGRTRSILKAIDSVPGRPPDKSEYLPFVWRVGIALEVTRISVMLASLFDKTVLQTSSSIANDHLSTIFERIPVGRIVHSFRVLGCIVCFMLPHVCSPMCIYCNSVYVLGDSSEGGELLIARQSSKSIQPD
jgi:hypothetical protein